MLRIQRRPIDAVRYGRPALCCSPPHWRQGGRAMDVLATSRAVPELQSPFTGFAGLPADPVDAGERPQPTTGVVLDSPFGPGLHAEEADAGEDVLTELLGELADDEFEDA